MRGVDVMWYDITKCVCAACRGGDVRRRKETCEVRRDEEKRRKEESWVG